jgi:hypothetical protein
MWQIIAIALGAIYGLIPISYCIVGLLRNNFSGGALGSSKLDNFPTNKFLQIRKFRQRPQNVNIKRLLQTQNGVL